MRRREFIAALTGLTLCPVRPHAQPNEITLRVPEIL